MGIAGDHGKPVIMVSGSEKACAEARAWVRNVVVAPVKKDLDLHGGVLLSKEKAHALIAGRAAEAVRRVHSIRPLRIRRPVRMRLERVSRSRLPETKLGVKVLDGRTYEVTGRDVESALNML
jgi:D-aminopeptidase